MARGHAAALPKMAAHIFANFNPEYIKALIVTRGPGGIYGHAGGFGLRTGLCPGP